MDDLELLKKELARYKQINNNLHKQMQEKEEEAKLKKNLNFVQLYKEHLKDLRKLTQDDKNALTVLLIMVEKMNKQNALVISQSTLQKVTGKSRTSIHNAVKALKKHNFIDIIKIGTANAYIVNANVFWQDHHDKKNKFAMFDAAIVADFEEQTDEYKENWNGIKLKPIPILKDELPILNEKDDDIEY